MVKRGCVLKESEYDISSSADRLATRYSEKAHEECCGARVREWTFEGNMAFDIDLESTRLSLM